MCLAIVFWNFIYFVDFLKFLEDVQQSESVEEGIGPDEFGTVIAKKRMHKLASSQSKVQGQLRQILNFPRTFFVWQNVFKLFFLICVLVLIFNNGKFLKEFF